MAEMSRQIWLASPMMRGDDVMAIQQRLHAAGAAIDVDGLYGRGTRAAVVDFQKRSGLEADGIVGQATWGRLFEAPGAAAVSLPMMDANNILAPGVLAELRSPHQRYKDSCAWSLTANGVSVVYAVMLDSVTLGGITLYNVEGLVHDAAGLDTALLGMSFLGRTEIRREGQNLTLVKRY